MIRIQWMIRFLLFLAVFISLQLLFGDLHKGDGLKWLIMDRGAPFAWAFLCMGITDAESYPDRLARSFTTVTREDKQLRIRASWLSNALTIVPALPFMASCAFWGIAFTEEATRKLPAYQMLVLGYIIAAGTVYYSILACLGFRCTVKKNYVYWVFEFLGREVRRKEYQNVRIIEYARQNGGGGGPVVTIEHDDGEAGRKTSKLRFRNLYKCSREELCDVLAEYLGQPESITEAPTKQLFRRGS